MQIPVHEAGLFIFPFVLWGLWMLSRDWGDGHAAYPFISLKWQPWNITRHSVLRMPLKEQAYLVSYNPDLVWLGTFKTVLLWCLHLQNPCPWEESLEGRSHRSPGGLSIFRTFVVGLGMARERYCPQIAPRRAVNRALFPFSLQMECVEWQLVNNSA